MSNNEVQEQIGSLVLEHQNAERDLAHLKEKALRIGRAFEAFGKNLANHPELVNDPSMHGTQGFIELIPIQPDHRKLLDLQQALSLTDEIRSATRKVQDLEVRKQSLGIK